MCDSLRGLVLFNNNAIDKIDEFRDKKVVNLFDRDDHYLYRILIITSTACKNYSIFCLEAAILSVCSATDEIKV